MVQKRQKMEYIGAKRSNKRKENVYAESVLFAMAHNPGWLRSRI